MKLQRKLYHWFIFHLGFCFFLKNFINSNWCTLQLDTLRHSMGKTINCYPWKIISWNQIFFNFFSSTVVFTKFLSKNCESKYAWFPHFARRALIHTYFVKLQQHFSNWRCYSWEWVRIMEFELINGQSYFASTYGYFWNSSVVW